MRRLLSNKEFAIDNFESPVYESAIIQTLTTLIHIIYIGHFYGLFTLCDLVLSSASLVEVLIALDDVRNFHLKFTAPTLV